MIKDHVEAMDYNLIEPLLTLLNEKNVSRAANKLNLTQSAVSRILARCRDAFDDELLVRSGNQYVLTSRAESLKPQLQAIKLQMEQLVQNRQFDPNTADQTIVIAGTDLDVIYLRKRISGIHQQAPGLKLQIRTSTPQVIDDLLAGKVDLALTAFDDQRSGLYRKLILDDTFCAVVGPAFELKGNRLSMNRYLSSRHGKFSFEQRTQGRVDDALLTLGVTREISMWLPTFSQIPPFLESSELIFSVPKSFARYLAEHFPIRILKLPFEVVPLRVYLYWHKRQQNSELYRWVRERLILPGTS